MDQKDIVKEKLSTSVLQKDLSFDSLSNSSYFDSSELGSVSSMDEIITECSGNDSQCFPLEQLREKYKKEFKSAIKDNYKFIMNEGIVESCKLTDCEFSVYDSDDVISEENSVTYRDFVKQYNNLVDWLSAIYEQINESNPTCLSEKYLNHAYHEELLQRLIRRTQFDEYATQLIRRYPYFKEDITLKKNHVAEQWNKLEEIVSSNDSRNVLKDVELDLSNFESWLILTNKNMRELQYQAISDNVSRERMLEIYMVQHNEVQPKSKLINSMLQMCDYLLSSWKPLSSLTKDRIVNAKNKAMVLQHSWETLFIQILEWQLRIEGNYDLKCKWANETQSENLQKESDLVVYASNMILNNIHTKENGGYFCETVINSHKKERHLNCNIEGHGSHNSLNTKFSSELQNIYCCCNLGSDFSDSSGIGISITTDKRILSKKVPDVITNYENFDIATPSEPESSLFFTEDEFCNDETLFYSSAHTHSLDILNHSIQSFKCSNHSDSAMTDGELCSNNSNNSKYKSKIIPSSRFQVKSNSKSKKNIGYVDKSLKQKHPVKRRLTNGISFTYNSNGLDIPLNDLVPGSDGNTNCDANSLNFERDANENEQKYSNCRLYFKGGSEDSLFRHNISKAFKKMDFTACESDSDVEDFRIMMSDSLKAFNFTKNCVAKTVRSRKMLDPIDLLEPLATCQTSVKCLKELEEAFNSTNTENNFGTLDILQLQSLLKDWINLEAQIIYHLQSGRQLFLSQVDLLQNQIYCCESVLKSIDITDFSPDVLLNAIHCLKAEKEKLLDIKQNVEKLKKSIASMTNKKYHIDVLAYGDISLRLEHFSALCHSLITRVGASLYSHLEIFEPSYKFYKLLRETYDLMKNFEKHVKMDTQPELISIEKSGIWTELREKLDEMECLLMNIKFTTPIKNILHNKLELARHDFRNLEMKKKYICENLILSDHHTVDIDYGCRRKMYGLIKKIMLVGLPLSAALLFGWVLKSSNLCEESLHNWEIVLFPNLFHSRGRPPT